MNRSLKIFLLLSSLYHLGILTFTFIVRAHSEDFKFLITLQENIPYLLYGALFGFIVFLFLVFFYYENNRNFNKQLKVKDNEIQSLKARLYDADGSLNKETTGQESHS